MVLRNKNQEIIDVCIEFAVPLIPLTPIKSMICGNSSQCTQKGKQSNTVFTEIAISMNSFSVSSFEDSLNSILVNGSFVVTILSVSSLESVSQFPYNACIDDGLAINLLQLE